MAAAALAKFRLKIFDDPKSLQNYVTQDDSPVATIVSIVTDNSGKYILFYTVA